MPTGYTYPVEEGTITTLQEYALLCARGMGACIMQRDEAMDATPRLQEPSPYYAQQLVAAKEELVRLKAMSDEDIESAFKVMVNNTKREHERALKDANEKIDRYVTMRQLVMAWKPPSPDHEGLRQFMLEQLRTGIPYDPENHQPQFEKTAAAWHEKRIAETSENIKRYTKEDGEERKRTEDRNQWLERLWAGLPK